MLAFLISVRSLKMRVQQPGQSHISMTTGSILNTELQCWSIAYDCSASFYASSFALANLLLKILK